MKQTKLWSILLIITVLAGCGGGCATEASSVDTETTLNLLDPVVERTFASIPVNTSEGSADRDQLSVLVSQVKSFSSEDRIPGSLVDVIIDICDLHDTYVQALDDVAPDDLAHWLRSTEILRRLFLETSSGVESDD